MTCRIGTTALGTLVALALAAAPGSAQPATTSVLHWIFDGEVQASARVGSTLYVGGTFTAVAPSANVLPPIYALSDTTGAVVAPTYAIADGSVAAIEPDGSGGYFIGGDFVFTSGGPRVYLAHMLADGSVDGAFAPALDGAVTSLARIGTTLYVAGDFTAIAGVPARRLGAVSATTGARVAWTPALLASTRPVQVLAAGDRVVVTGADSQPMVQSANVTAFDAVSAAELWVAYLAGGVRSPATPGPALIAGTRLIAAHSRGMVNLSLATGAADPSWNPQVSPQAIALSGTTLYLGGAFSTVAGQPRAHLAAIDVTSAALLPWQPAVAANVTGLAVSTAGTVFVSGEFTTIGGVARHHLAAIDAAGTVTPWVADARPETATLVAGAPGTVLVASGVTAHGSVARSRLAAFDLTTGALLPWAPVSVEDVRFLAATASRVYAGLSGSVLVLDSTLGTQLDFYPSTTALFAQAPWIYWATNAGGASAVRRADLATGTQDPSWRPATFVPEAITQDGTTLYFASSTAGLAAVDARTARTIWANAGMTARHVAVSGDTLVVVSPLLTIGTVDARTGVSMGSWPGPTARSLVVADGRVMVGSFGVFVSYPALSAFTFAGTLAPWDAALNGTVASLGVAGDVLVAGGTLSTRTPQALRGLAVYPLLGAVAPTALRARPKGTATEFTWAAPAAAPAGYVIEAGLASGQTIGTLPIGNVTSFSLDVPPGSYYVRVRTSGVAGGGAEELTNEVLVRGGCTAPPLPPTALAAAVNGASLTLTWTAPDAFVSRYVLSAGSGPGLSDIATVSLAGASTSVAGPVPSQTYYVRLAAVNACGTSAATPDLTVVVGAADALPGAPSAPRQTLLGGFPALEWTAPSGTVLGYVIEAGTEIGQANLGTATLSGPFPQFLVPFLTPPGTYTVRVRAFNAAGTGPASPDFVLVWP